MTSKGTINSDLKTCIIMYKNGTDCEYFPGVIDMAPGKFYTENEGKFVRMGGTYVFGFIGL